MSPSVENSPSGHPHYRDSYGYIMENYNVNVVYKEMTYTKTLYSETMVWTIVSNASHLVQDHFPPNVNFNSIQGSYYWAGLIKTTGAERMEATCHSYRSQEQSAQCPVLTLTAQIQPPDWTKWKFMVVVRNVSLKTIIWMLYWYVVWNIVLYEIVL